MKKWYATMFMGVVITACLLSGCGKIEELSRVAETVVQESSIGTEKGDDIEKKAESPVESGQEAGFEDETESQCAPVKILLRNRTESYSDEADGTELLDVGFQDITLSCETLKGMDVITKELTRVQEDVLSQLRAPEEDGEEGYYLYAYAKEHYEMVKEDGGAVFFPYYYNAAYNVRRADSGIISLTKMEESYMGGAHGSNIENVYNFEPNTGEKIVLSDLSDNKDDFLALCLENITRQADKMQKGEDGPIFFDDYENNIVSILTDDNFYLNKEGVVFISQEYMLQPYAGGIIEFTVPYDALKESLKEKYLFSEKTVDYEVTTE